MLKSIRVKNFAVIEAAEISFKDGLNVFTGETGAGKSILIEALGFALGGRGSADMIREGATRLEVAAEFGAAGLPASVLEKFGLRRGGAFTIKRELDAKGRGRAYIDSAPVSAAALGEIGGFILDFHGQHDHQSLLKPAMHLELLDRFVGLEPKTAEFAAAFKLYNGLCARLEASQLSAAEKERLLDLYRYQLREIEDAAIKPGEDDELEALLPRLKNADKLRSLAGAAYEALYSAEGSAVERAGKALKAAEELAAIDASASESAQSLNRALIQLEDAANGLSAYKDNVDINPQELDALISRQDVIGRIKKKYGPSLEQAFAFAAQLRGKIEDLASADERADKLAAEIREAQARLKTLSGKLHAARVSAAEKLAALVTREIVPLGFAGVKFSAAVEMDETAFSATGSDSVEFLFSPNPGYPLKPLKNIASGGEMARVMLGIKTVLAAADKIPVLVFDEVDAGVGAVVGRLVGDKLLRIAAGRQVLCVTHLAQVAAFADAHFRVAKDTGGSRAITTVAQLDSEGRAEEIAKMLGGKKAVSKLGLQHAKELLKESKRQAAA